MEGTEDEEDGEEVELLRHESTPYKAPTSKPTSPANNTSLGVKIWILIALALQNAAHALLSRYSKGILKETYDGSEVILVGEVLKLVISGYISFKDPSETGVSRYAMPSCRSLTKYTSTNRCRGKGMGQALVAAIQFEEDHCPSGLVWDLQHADLLLSDLHRCVSLLRSITGPLYEMLMQYTPHYTPPL